MDNEKQFKLYCRGHHILTCDLRGASFLPAFAAPRAELAALALGAETDVLDAEGVAFTWKRIA